MTAINDRNTNRGSQAALEAMYIEQYLTDQGYTLDTLKLLPEAQATALMRAASLYASVRLAEVETRSHLVDELHGGHPI